MNENILISYLKTEENVFLAQSGQSFTYEGQPPKMHDHQVDDAMSVEQDHVCTTVQLDTNVDL